MENLIDDYIFTFKILPCIDVSIFDNNDFCVNVSWLLFSIEFWFGDVSDLL